MDGSWLWAAVGAREAKFRQTLLWSRGVYGGKLSSLVPPHTEYGVSPDTVEVLQHAIFAPTSRPMRSYTLQLEIPAGFRLVGVKEGGRNFPFAWNPSKVAARDVEVDGQPYRQYDLDYDVSKLKDVHVALLPIKREGAQWPDGKAAFRFRRLIDANVTELTTALDVKPLPPVNGRRMKTIFYPQYDSNRNGCLPPDGEVMAALVRQGVAAGMDIWICCPVPSDQSPWAEFCARTNGAIKDNHGRIWAAFGNLPLWGAPRNSELGKLVATNPSYQARYFNGVSDVSTKGNLIFCFTYALGEGWKDFAAALAKDYQGIKAGLPPGADTIFLNNENYPWGREITPDKRYCFCDRCKEAFKKFAGLPADMPLSDQDIFAKHRDAWTKFWRSNQSGRLMGAGQGGRQRRRRQDGNSTTTPTTRTPGGWWRASPTSTTSASRAAPRPSTATCSPGLTSP